MPFPNLAGRPVEYKEEYLEKIPEYIQQCLDKDELPTKAGLAVFIGTSKQTLLHWAELNQHLLDALKDLDSLQENQVWQRALKGEYNSNIAKLLLANHGYSDRIENTQNINLNYKDLSDEELDRLIKSKQG